MVGMIRQMEFVLFSFHFEERVILAQTFQSNRTCGVGLFDFARRKFFLWHQDFSYCSSKVQSDRLDKHNHNQAPRSHSSDQNVHFIINIFSKYSFNRYQMFTLIINMSFDILLTKHQNSWASCEEMNQQKESRFFWKLSLFCHSVSHRWQGGRFSNRTKCLSFAEICSEE